MKYQSRLIYKDVITCTNVVISSFHIVLYTCIDLPRLTGSHITVDVDEYESLSSAIIPILPISLPRDLSGQL